MNKDLTHGNPGTVLWQFCIPMFGSILFQQLYNIADSLVAGKFISDDALAAVGNGYEVTLLFIAVAFGCNIGCSVVTAQKFGAKQYGEMKTAVFTTLIASGVICGILMLLGFTCLDGLLKWIHTPDNVFADSRCYLEVYILSLPFVFFYNVATGIFSALGDSRTPFWFLAASTLSNIAMDIWFVTAFDMGVAGGAWATRICLGISCVLAVLVVLRRLARIQTDKVPLFSWRMLQHIARVAVPSMLQQSFISVGNMVLQGIINSFGSGVMAGYSGAIKLNNLVVTSFTTLGNGVSNYTAQKLGTGKHERVRQGHKAGIKMVWMLCIPLAAAYFFLGGPLMKIFLKDGSADAMNTGITFLRIVAPFYFVVSVKLVTDGVLRGSGRMKEFMIATFSDLILRVGLAFVFSSRLGSVGIWLSWPVGWIVGTAASLYCYLKTPSGARS